MYIYILANGYGSKPLTIQDLQTQIQTRDACQTQHDGELSRIQSDASRLHEENKRLSIQLQIAGAWISE